MPTKSSNKPNHIKDIILLFSVPVGIVVFAAIAIYAPRLFANPKYDFVYSVCSSYTCDDNFYVDESGYVGQYSSNTSNYYNTSTLRYYSVKNDSTTSLTLEEARQYKLNTSSRSPDGYSLVEGDSNSGFLLWSNYESGWYLKDGVINKKIELSNKDSYYSENIKFLGWVEK